MLWTDSPLLAKASQAETRTKLSQAEARIKPRQDNTRIKPSQAETSQCKPSQGKLVEPPSGTSLKDVIGRIIFLLTLIYEHGGVWIDSAIPNACLNQVDRTPAFLIDKYPWFYFFAAQKRCHLIKVLLRRYKAYDFERERRPYQSIINLPFLIAKSFTPLTASGTLERDLALARMAVAPFRSDTIPIRELALWLYADEVVALGKASGHYGHLKKHDVTLHYAYVHQEELNMGRCISSARSERPNNAQIVVDGDPCDLGEVTADLIITTKLDVVDQCSNALYLPAYALFLSSFVSRANVLPGLLDPKTYPKTEFCFFAYSNSDERFEGVRRRKELYFRLNERKSVSNLGTCYGGTGRGYFGHQTNSERMRPFKFAIAIENSSIRGYVSEKAVSPLIAGAIPIYWGAPDISEHFNRERMILLDDFRSVDECIDHILALDSDDDAFNQIVSRPVFVNDQRLRFESYIS